jgi:hypothetical protein
LRAAARARLLHTARLRQPPTMRGHFRITAWIGAHMVRWGCKLQSSDATPSPGRSHAAGQSPDTASPAWYG